MTSRLRLVIGFVVSVILLVGGTATAFGVYHQRGMALRGWTDATQTADLPQRVPLAGVNVELTQYDTPTLGQQLDTIAAAGFSWVRQEFKWSDIEKTEGQFDFSRYDALVDAASQRGLQVVAVLDTTPPWARRPDSADWPSSPPASMAAFGKFAGQVAARYGDKVNTYQVWDEPNISTGWGKLDPRPVDYAAMLKEAYTQIHAHDSTATVIAAALAPNVESGPNNLSDVLYLRALYDAGAKDFFDAAAGKPYGFGSGPDDRAVSMDVLNFSHIILLREEMVKHGDGQKALWGSNFGWNSLPADWKGAGSIWGQVDADTQRRYTQDAYLRAAREWPWMGGLILEHWQPPAPADDPIQGFAVAPHAADWFQAGAFFKQPVFDFGLHTPTDTGFQYQGNWRFGPLGADVVNQPNVDPPADGSDHVLSFSFTGSALAFQVRRADYVAFLYVTVDGQPANALPRTSGGDAYILLKSPELDTRTDLIVAAKNLDPNVAHKVETRAYLGSDRWELAGIAIGQPPDTRRYDLALAAGGVAVLLGLVGLVVVIRRLPRLPVPRESLIAYVRRMADILIGLGVSIVGMLGIFFTWGGLLPNVFRTDPPTVIVTVLTAGLAYFSTSLILTAITLAVLWFIIYNRPVVGLALITFWAPFFLKPVQLYTSALPMVEVCLLLTFSAVVVRGLVHWKARPVIRLRTIDWVMLAFVVLATLTLLWSEQRAPALREWRTMIIEPVLFYVLLRVVKLSDQDVIRLTDVLIAAGVAVAVIGLVDYVGGGSGVVIAEQGSRRLASVYGSPNNAALFLGRCLPFALAMILIVKDRLRRVVIGISLAVMALAIILTQSGGAALLGVPAAVICVALLWNRKCGAILSAVVIAGIASLILLSRFVPRLQGLLDLSRSSSFVRVQVWISAINLLKERPILGAGLDQFLYLYRSRYILPDAWREPDLSHPHNLILDYWISLGILGLVILVALQVVFWRTALAAWRRWRGINPLLAAVAVGAMGSMADFLAHGLVDNSYFVVDLSFVFCLTLALVARLDGPEEETAIGEAKPAVIGDSEVLTPAAKATG